MAKFVPAFLEAGARIIGGCCGTTPTHIAAMAGVLNTSL
jgi:methionine synthase I (cobalamin-dependent)